MLGRFIITAIGGAVAGAICWHLGVSALNTLPGAAITTGLGVGVGAVLGELLYKREIK